MGRKKASAVEPALPAKELLSAMKGVYVDRNGMKEIKIGLPSPDPEMAKKEVIVPLIMAGLIDEYIGFSIVSNGHPLTDQTKRMFSGRIVTELFRLAISSDKTFEKYLQEKSETLSVQAAAR